MAPWRLGPNSSQVRRPSDAVCPQIPISRRPVSLSSHQPFVQMLWHVESWLYIFFNHVIDMNLFIRSSIWLLLPHVLITWGQILPKRWMHASTFFGHAIGQPFSCNWSVPLRYQPCGMDSFVQDFVLFYISLSLSLTLFFFLPFSIFHNKKRIFSF